MPEPKPRIGSGGSQAELIAFLESGRGFPGSPSCRRIDTHAAIIFLAGDRAWKLKRAVRYPYLDFTTAELRRAALEAELRLNRRTAPDLYLGVHPIVRAGEGFQIGGAGEPADWILEMRRFPDGALLDEIAREGPIDERLLLRLADCISAFHEKALPVARPHGADDVRQVIEGNARSFQPYLDLFGSDRVQTLLQVHRDTVNRHAALLDKRGRAGRIRRVHGDLHLANIALIDGEPVPFDCLEFSDKLATTDTMYDLGFLLMDLLHRGLRGEANLVFNRYVDLSADEEGVRLLPLFMSMRATIRAHVLAAASRLEAGASLVDEAQGFLALAERLILARPAALLAIGGLSGTGKSALARAVGGDFGTAPGARILRSDVLRKRLAGVPPEQPLPASLYISLASRTVYELLADHAGRHLSSGTFVIADAVMAGADERIHLSRAAAHTHVPFCGIWLEAPEATRLERVGQRAADASDADAAVVRAQSSRAIEAPIGWHRLQAAGALLETAARAREMVKGEIAAGD